MWLFLSRRLRTWLLFSIGIPLAGALVHRVAERSRANNPTSTTTKALTRADATLGKVSRRKSGKRAG